MRSNPRSGAGDADDRLPRGLSDDPFDYLVTKSGEVRIARGGRVVTVVRGTAAQKLLTRLGRDPVRDQQLLARATGHYKHGNERDRGR